MLVQTDFDIIMKKLDKFEEDLKKLENEIKILKQQTPIPSIWPNNPNKVPAPYWGDLGIGKGGAIPCYFDSLPPEDRMKPTCVSCPCPKCSPYALSTGSLVDSGTIQQWRVATENEDYEE